MRPKDVWRIALAFAVTTGAAVVAQQAPPQSGAIVIKAKTIYTITRGVVSNGEVLVADGKIKAVGRSVDAPPGATVYNAIAVMPGMIDAHTHLALSRLGDRIPGPVTSEWKAVEHLRLDDPMLQIALSGGVTSVITRPGSGVISSGQAVALKLKRKPIVLKPYVDLKMAVRPLINLREGETPQTVMGWYATASEYFRKAKVYLQQQEDYKAGRLATKPPVDERLEALAAVLRGDVMVHTHTHYPSENQMVMKLAKEYGFIDRLAFGHAEEVAPMAEVLRGSKIIPVIGPMMIVRYFGDSRSHNIVKELMEVGVSASLQTDNSREQFKDFREYAAMLVRHGLKEEHGLQAITINGAKAMMLADRIGSIEVGKDADLVLLDGHPFDLTADRIERVIVDGIVEYERKDVWQTRRPTPVGPFAPLRAARQLPEGTFALTNAHVFPISRSPMKGATLLVEKGRISAVGTGARVPSGVPTVDVGGRVVTPGWVVARTYPNDWVGDLKWQVQNDEVTEPIVPEMNARFAVDPWFPSYAVNREVGITTQNVTPGRLNFIGGSGVVVKSRGMDVEQMVRREPSSLVISLTRDATEFWGRQNKNKQPLTLEAAVKQIRDTLTAAQQYIAGGAREFNQRFEALRPALARQVPVIVHAKRTDEIRAAIDLARDFHLRFIVSGAVQAHRLSKELAAAGVEGIILGDAGTYTSDIRGGGDDYNMQSAAILSRAGLKVGFFGPGASRRATPTGRLDGETVLNAAWAFRNGATEEEALKMVTLYPAEMSDMGSRIGSLDAGKDADLVVLEGHPFDYRAIPQIVYIDGRLVHSSVSPTASTDTASALPDSLVQQLTGAAAAMALMGLVFVCRLLLRTPASIRRSQA